MEFSRPPNEAPQQCVVAFSHHAVMGVYDADGDVIEMPSWAATPDSPTCVTFSPTWLLHRVLFSGPTSKRHVFESAVRILRCRFRLEERQSRSKA